MRVITLPEETKNEPQDQKYTLQNILSWLRFALVIGTLFFIFRFAIGIEIIHGNSMNPTIESDSVLLMNKIFFTPEHGDIVVLEDPEGYHIIKRIIGLPGDKVQIVQGIVHLNGVPLTENYTQGTSIDIDETIVPQGEVYIIGDNRSPGESLDSRAPDVGTLPIKNIIGQAEFAVWGQSPRSLH